MNDENAHENESGREYNLLAHDHARRAARASDGGPDAA